jgi:hypothetical protein
MRRVTGIAAGAVLAATGLATAACGPGGSAAASGSSTSTTGGLTTTTTAPATTAPTTAAGVSGSAADVQKVAAAYTKTISAGSAKLATTTQVGAGQQNVPLTATGVISFANGSADLTETLPGGQGSGETRFLDGKLYTKLPSGLTSRLSNGKPWISLDVAKLSQQGDGSLQQLITDSPADPSTVLGYLRGAGTQVNTVGPDTVDGAATTHYSVTLDLDKAAQGQNAQTQQATQALERELGTHTLPADVWIDQTGRLRKISLRETLTGAGMPSTGVGAKPTGPVSFQFTAVLSDFGVPVTVSAPQPDQTTDLTAKLDGGSH